MKMFTKNKLIFFTLSVFFILPVFSQAADIYLAKDDGLWSDPTTWDGGVVPGAGDTVYLRIPEVSDIERTVKIDQNITVEKIGISGNGFLQTLEILQEDTHLHIGTLVGSAGSIKISGANNVLYAKEIKLGFLNAPNTNLVLETNEAKSKFKVSYSTSFIKNIDIRQGKYECEVFNIQTDKLLLSAGGELTGTLKSNHSDGVRDCNFKVGVFEHSGKLSYPLDLNIIGDFKNDGEFLGGFYYSTPKQPQITIDGNIENNRELSDGFYFHLINNSSDVQPIKITGTAKISLWLFDENNSDYHFTTDNNFNLKALRIVNRDVIFNTPSEAGVFIDSLETNKNTNFLQTQQLQFGSISNFSHITASQAQVILNQGVSRLPNITANEIILNNGYFQYGNNDSTLEASQVVVMENADLWTIYPITIIGDLDNKGKLGSPSNKYSNLEITGNLTNSGEVRPKTRLSVQGKITNTGTFRPEIIYLFGDLENQADFNTRVYLYDNPDSSKKELIFSTSTNPKIYLQEDIRLSKKVREIPNNVISNGFKFILENGAYLKLPSIENLNFVGEGLVLETSRLENFNSPTSQIIMSGPSAYLYGTNIAKNILLDSPIVWFKDTPVLETESLEITPQTKITLDGKTSIKGKVLNKGQLNAKAWSYWLVIEDDFTNLGNITVQSIFFKNLGDQYQYFLKNKNDPNAGELAVSKRGDYYDIGPYIRNKQPYDLILRDEQGEIFKVFKINQEMVLPEIGVPPAEPEQLEFETNNVSDVLIDQEFTLNFTPNRKLRVTDSTYDYEMEELNFYLSTNFQEGSNIYPEVISLPTEEGPFSISLRIPEPNFQTKIYLKNDQGDILAESNFFQVLPEPKKGKIYFRFKGDYDEINLLITDKNGTEIKNVTVPDSKFIEEVTCELGPLTISASATTSAPLPQYFLSQIVYPICNKTVTVTLDEDMHIPSQDWTCQQEGKVPVLLVPGIMGSDTKGRINIYPVLPKESPEWNSGKLILHDPGVDLPGFNKGLNPGWEDIRDRLEDYGYIRDCNIIDVPYDWRLEVPKVRDKYLIPWINEAKERTGMDKVDIVAHSMGGLVSRSYIQSEKYKNDVRNFAMVGTPNKGAALVYPIWAGGDPMAADEYQGSDGWFSPAKYFYTNTLNENYEVMTDKNDLCIWGIFSFELNDALSDTPLSCNTERVYDFIHKQTPSIGHLMPVYDNSFQGVFDQPREIIEEKNEFLVALNGGKNYRGEIYSLPDSINERTSGRDIIFFSASNRTAKTVNVGLAEGNQDSSYLYQDGVFRYFDPGNGDGTVPSESVGIGGVPISDDISNEKHSFLINDLKEEITNFIISE